MALSAKLIQISSGSSPVHVAYTGVGFRPKALIFFVDMRTTTGVTTTGSEMPMEIMGFTDGTTEACMTNNDDYSAGNPFYKAQCVFASTSAGGVGVLSATCVSLDADGFTLDWSVVNAAVTINVLCLGGSDITGAKVLTWTGPTGAVGNVSTTGVGFKPDGMIAIAGNSFPSQGGVGMATAASEQGLISAAYASGTVRYQLTTSILAGMGGTEEVRFLASFVRFDADGFTLNWIGGESLSTTFCAGLFLKGIRMKVGALTEKATDGGQAITGVGFVPKAVVFLSTGLTASSVPVDTGLVDLMTGAATGPSERAVTELGDSTTTGMARLSTTACISHLNNSATKVGTADFTSFDADGFTLNWQDTDGTARQTIFMALGDTASPSGLPVIRRPRKTSRSTTW